MFSKGLIAIGIVCGTVGFVVFQVGFAGDNHVTVVKENLQLYNENVAFKKENEELKAKVLESAEKLK